VLVDSFAGAKTATEHLLDEGWRQPACITGPADAETARQRLNGYLAALGEFSGAKPSYRHAPFRQGGGRLAAAQLLDSAEPPDALFVANSQMALGVLGELRRRRIKVGTDIGVIVFDDAPWAPFVDSPLSVVAQPAYDIGVQAAQLLTERIRQGSPSSPRTVTLSTTLIVRESSRRRAA
jgi:LacI family transcriptional regulator